jgi:hypothetical protein
MRVDIPLISLNAWHVPSANMLQLQWMTNVFLVVKDITQTTNQQPPNVLPVMQVSTRQEAPTLALTVPWVNTVVMVKKAAQIV